jgi:hypothetical protein
LWGEIVTFGRYGFNKSHSVAYSLVAYRMAWFKVNHPGVFYTALLNNDTLKVETWVYDAAEHGIDVVQPSINKSGIRWVWSAKESVIFAPLSIVKYFGEAGAEKFVEYRSGQPHFDTFEQLAATPKRLLNKRAKKLLFYAEAFRGITGDPATLIEDFVDLPVLTSTQAQREALGFVLPNPRILAFFAKERARGRVCGFVKDIEARNKGRGNYFVVHLSPSGGFWSKEAGISKLAEGDLISVTPGNRGAVEIQRMRL